MNCIVTGTAGFIGSHVSERLLKDGHTVIGIDCFTDYYSRDLKQKNLSLLQGKERFTFLEHDIAVAPLEKLVSSADYIFHLCGQAGVRASWGADFEIYTHHNILATQRLLEACKGKKSLKGFIYASSSSIYGDAEAFPTREEATPKPVSPYGVSKLAAEHLSYLYGKNYGVPTISFRYFTVFGPRQRPDMAFNKFIKAGLSRGRITVYGDGEQTRDFTFISDIVDAHVLAMGSSRFGEVYNIGGGARTSVNRVLDILQGLGCQFEISCEETQKGDVLHTYADIAKARQFLGYSPKVSLEEGLKRQFEWQKGLAAGL